MLSIISFMIRAMRQGYWSQDTYSIIMQFNERPTLESGIP